MKKKIIFSFIITLQFLSFNVMSIDNNEIAQKELKSENDIEIDSTELSRIQIVRENELKLLTQMMEAQELKLKSELVKRRRFVLIFFGIIIITLIFIAISIIFMIKYYRLKKIEKNMK